MIRLAYVVDTIESPMAGTEKQLLMLLGQLDPNRFETHLFCLRSSPWLEQHGLPFNYHILGLNSLVSADFVRAAKRLRQMHEQRPFDILQTFFLDSELFGVFAARQASIPVVISSRRNTWYRNGRLTRMMLRYMSRSTTSYIANSQAVKKCVEETERVAPSRVEVIYNGLDVAGIRSFRESHREAERHRIGLADDDLLIISIANLRPVKNLEEFVAAAALIMKRVHNVRFAILGEGPERALLHRTIESNQLSGRFELVGAVEDVRPWLAAADIGVLCSHSEGFSNSVVEYMSAGLGIVASDVGGNREAAPHGECSIIYEPGNAGLLASQLEKLVTDRHMAYQLGNAAARRAMEQYSIERCVAAHEAYYDELVRRARTN